MNKQFAWGIVAVAVVLTFFMRYNRPAPSPGPASPAPVKTTGQLSLVSPDTEMKLQSEGQNLALTPGHDPGPLTPGTYITEAMALTRGNFRLASASSFGKYASVSVVARQTTRVDFGPPLVVKAQVTNPAGPDISIGLLITGKAGETYGPAAQQNGAKLAPPKVTILDEKGKVLDSGSFKFG